VKIDSDFNMASRLSLGVHAIYRAGMVLVNGQPRLVSVSSFGLESKLPPLCQTVVGRRMRLQDDLLSVMVCPISKQPLIYFPDGVGADASPFLLSPSAKARFAISSGIAVLLPEEAHILSDEDTVRLTALGRQCGIATGSSGQSKR
jgi:uncharacterized protein YbaR (Trm112 family)